MLQQITVKTHHQAPLKPLLESAIANEMKIVSLGLQRTRQRLAEFEQQFGLSSADFARQLQANEIEETPDFSEWRMELGLLALLEKQYQALQDVQLD